MKRAKKNLKDEKLAKTDKDDKVEDIIECSKGKLNLWCFFMKGCGHLVVYLV